jgi:AcrR family transcriptional regulator
MPAAQSPPRKPKSPRRYHHGDLTNALVAATIELIEERGLEQVSVREAAKRAGVSSGAPFRHFATKTALMTAVAEEAMERLKDSVSDALRDAAEQGPLQRFEAIGQAYLRWAIANPTHFQVISSRSLIAFESSERLTRANGEIRTRMVALLSEAKASGSLRTGLDIDHLILSARALVYGLARMAVDGHLPEWHAREPATQAASNALGLFIEMVRHDGQGTRASSRPGRRRSSGA